jgi:hypothetical protein
MYISILVYRHRYIEIDIDTDADKDGNLQRELEKFGQIFSSLYLQQETKYRHALLNKQQIRPHREEV